MARSFPIPMPLSRAEALRAGSRQGTRAVPKLDVVGVGSNPDRRVAHGVALRTRTILHSLYYTARITQPVAGDISGNISLVARNERRTPALPTEAASCRRVAGLNAPRIAGPGPQHSTAPAAPPRRSSPSAPHRSSGSSSSSPAPPDGETARSRLSRWSQIHGPLQHFLVNLTRNSPKITHKDF